MSHLSSEEYEARKQCLDDLRKLVKAEQEQIFVILRKHSVEYSENSNGIFFDLSRIPEKAFQDILSFLVFCQANRKDFELRDKDMETSRLHIGSDI